MIFPNFERPIMIKHMIAVVALVATSAFATEKIVIANAQGPQQSMTPQFLRIVEEANAMQTRYQFVTDFKPGGFESIAIRHMLEDPQRRLGTITNSVMEAMNRGFVNERDIVPVFSFGDSCWTIITRGGTQGQGLSSLAKDNSVKDLTGGGPAPGGAAHLTALEIGQRYNLPVRYIVYKSNAEALVNMVGDEKSVNIVLERARNYMQFRDRSPGINALAVSCPQRHALLPTVPTLAEQGIDAPYIWNFLVASAEMSTDRRKDIEDIFTQATRRVGRETTQELSDMQSPVFSGVKSSDHYRASIDRLKRARAKWSSAIKAN
jgi:tripartite-type tricarboxylate transporter receptor subunit TctC